MKKILSLFLASVLAFSASAVAFAGDDSCGFAVASDLHYVEPLENVDDYFESDKFGSNENGYAYQHESGFIIDEFLKQCAADDNCDFILVPGDLATYSRDFAGHALQLAEKFRKFENETGKQIYVINGNHDNGAGSEVDHTKFTEIYHEFGYDTAFSIDESCCSYATNLNEKYALIAFDSCDENYALTNGVSTERLGWVKEQVEVIRESGRKIIMIMHHNLLEHSPLELITSDKYIVSLPRTYASLFADWGIKLVFTGHTHLGDAVSHTSPAGNVIYDFCTTSLCEYPFQYRTFDMTDKVISYGMKNIEKIDTEALSATVSGYTPEQLEAMSTDLVAYGRDRLSLRTEEMLRNTISAKGLGIAEDSIAYDTVNSACNKVQDIFSMNLYGENSVSSLAEEYGIAIPESSYKNIWEIGNRIYLDFSSGKKVFAYDSAEVQIISTSAQLALRDYLAETADETIFSAVNEIASGDAGIAKTVTVASLKIFGGATLSQRFIASILLPFADLYANEGDGVENISGEIPGLFADESGFANIADYISLFFERLFRYFKIAFEAMF